MEFQYSNRILRFTFDILMVMLLMQPYVIIGEKISNNAFFWIVNFVMLFIVFKLTSFLVQIIPVFKKRGICLIQNGRLTLHLEKRTYECNIKSDIEELLYMQANHYKKILGTDWDKFEIRVKGQKIVLLAKPDEKENAVENKELYKVFLMIKEASDLVEDTDTYAGDFIEYYKKK